MRALIECGVDGIMTNLSRAVADGGGRLMGRFGDDKIEEVRSRADIVEIVGAHVRLRRAGRNFVGLCPFHNEKTPSFSVNAERGFFHCFGCGAGGSVFNFIMRVEGLTFPEAVRSIARKYARDDTRARRIGTGGGRARIDATRPARSPRTSFAHVLWNTDDGALARDYLKSRGISVETARAHSSSDSRLAGRRRWRKRWNGADCATRA